MQCLRIERFEQLELLIVKWAVAVYVHRPEGMLSVMNKILETLFAGPVPNRLPIIEAIVSTCLLYTSPSPRDRG